MNLSPTDRREVRHLAAQIVAREILARLEDPDELIVLPVPTIAALAGLTPRKVSQLMPVVDSGYQTKGVRLSDYKAHLAARSPKPPATPFPH